MNSSADRCPPAASKSLFKTHIVNGSSLSNRSLKSSENSSLFIFRDDLGE